MIKYVKIWHVGGAAEEVRGSPTHQNLSLKGFEYHNQISRQNNQKFFRYLNLNYKCQPQEATRGEVFSINPLGTMNACTK